MFCQPVTSVPGKEKTDGNGGGFHFPNCSSQQQKERKKKMKMKRGGDIVRATRLKQVFLFFILFFLINNLYIDSGTTPFHVYDKSKMK